MLAINCKELAKFHLPGLTHFCYVSLSITYVMIALGGCMVILIPSGIWTAFMDIEHVLN